MVFRQPGQVVLQRIQPCRGNDTGLPHAAAEDLAGTFGAGDEFTPPGEHAAGRRAETLGQAGRHGFEPAAQGLDGHARLRCRVEDPGAIEVRGKAAPLCKRQRVVDPRLRQHLATDRVLEGQQAGAREMRVVGLDRGLDFGKVERAVRTVGQRLRLHRGEHGPAARLIAIGMRLLPDQVFVAALAMRHQRSEVGLRTGGKEQRRLEPEHLCSARLQRIDRRVVAEDIVADLGRRHGGAHARRGLGDGVAAQVDEHARSRSGCPARSRGWSGC